VTPTPNNIPIRPTTAVAKFTQTGIMTSVYNLALASPLVLIPDSGPSALAYAAALDTGQVVTVRWDQLKWS